MTLREIVEKYGKCSFHEPKETPVHKIIEIHDNSATCTIKSSWGETIETEVLFMDNFNRYEVVEENEIKE